MSYISVLERLGLTPHETSVYVGLLERGQMNVAEIGRLGNLYRHQVYRAVSSLEEKGLVAHIVIGKRKRFTAESPELLREIANDVTADLSRTLPVLLARYKVQGMKSLVKFYEGKRGIAHVFDDLVATLRVDDVYFRFTSSKDLDLTESYLPKNYRAMRDKKRLSRFIINSETSARQRGGKLNRQVKTIPKEFDLFDYEISQIIYGNKVAFIDFNTETAFIIENDKVAEFQKKIFQLLYGKL